LKNKIIRRAFFRDHFTRLRMRETIDWWTFISYFFLQKLGHLVLIRNRIAIKILEKKLFDGDDKFSKSAFLTTIRKQRRIIYYKITSHSIYNIDIARNLAGNTIWLLIEKRKTDGFNSLREIERKRHRQLLKLAKFNIINIEYMTYSGSWKGFKSVV
jgi:hypothetical protein